MSTTYKFYLRHVLIVQKPHNVLFSIFIFVFVAYVCSREDFFSSTIVE